MSIRTNRPKGAPKSLFGDWCPFPGEESPPKKESAKKAAPRGRSAGRDRDRRRQVRNTSPASETFGTAPLLASTCDHRCPPVPPVPVTQPGTLVQGLHEPGRLFRHLPLLVLDQPFKGLQLWKGVPVGGSGLVQVS